MSVAIISSQLCLTCLHYNRKKGMLTGSCRLNNKKMNPYLRRCPKWEEMTTGQKVDLKKTLEVVK